MKNSLFAPLVLLLFIALSCSNLGTHKRNGIFYTKNRKLQILLTDDGRCSYPQSANLETGEHWQQACTYSIEDGRIQFFPVAGNGTWGTISDRCIKFTNSEFCTDF